MYQKKTRQPIGFRDIARRSFASLRMTKINTCDPKILHFAQDDRNNAIHSSSDAFSRIIESVKTAFVIIGSFFSLLFATFMFPPRIMVIEPSSGLTATDQSASSTAAAASGTTVKTISGAIASMTQAAVNGVLSAIWLPQMHASFDAAAYDAKMLALANIPAPRIVWNGTSTNRVSSTVPSPLAKWWPVKVAYPNAGALLPMNRIVAYYGNLYSKQMGILGELPPDQMLAQLASTSAMWTAADPSTPVVPALDYIVVSAQESPGPDGKYRLRMPSSQVAKILQMADQIHGVVILDVQVGLSNVQTEIPLLEPYLKLPQVHLALDPEFSMKNGAPPGTEIGTMNADDINFAAQYLAKLVRDNNLPPKVLVVHRFTQAMVRRYQDIKPLPEVQIVMDMDGFGSMAKKINTYQSFIQPEPVQFTGIKLFYKNDARAGHLMTPQDVLKLTPQPSFIQYQ